ncbi:ABC transporter ATP-binding protein [Candidatus Gracilibacteria bacterium]|nr:ABC transporter ATP-binding protein [Candidatus Gracilibacteria bacterium]
MRFFQALIGYKKIPVLGGLNFEIKQGEWVFLYGASGSGKSTLLETMAGLRKPLAGSFIDHRGRDVYRLKGSELRAYQRTNGMIFQDYKLIPSKTVLENISYALEICRYGKSTIQRRTRELLTEVGMYDKKDVYPTQLSGGECQRVAIARALIHEPHTLIADEPTGNLDQKNMETILDIMKRIHAEGTTIVFATHDRDLVHLVPGSREIDIDTFHQTPTFS